MRNLPAWIPAFNAWMSAVLLVILIRGLAVVIDRIWGLGFDLMALPIKWKVILYFLALLSPILVIAIAHHFLQMFLDRFFPETRSAEIHHPEGVIPSLMSWWEGFYGWMAISLATIVSLMFEFLLLPTGNSPYSLLAWWDEIKDLFTLPTLVRIITAAYLYHLEYIVRHHLMSVGADDRANR
ncbi:MAG: hypothetical protein KME17_21425 [Cyanosarcina radialis HA8281-LM2]|jgi:hypothetical protein|nr:hypothetical protein [Cyanosarcina radialis HA8281-LM2]